MVEIIYFHVQKPWLAIRHHRVQRSFSVFQSYWCFNFVAINAESHDLHTYTAQNDKSMFGVISETVENATLTPNQSPLNISFFMEFKSATQTET